MSGEKSKAIIPIAVGLLIIIAFIAFILRSNKRTVTVPRQSEQADVANIKWEIKSTEWPLGEARNCVFFPSGFGSGFAGCWHEYDESTGAHNRNGEPNDHSYIMTATVPENVKRALAQQHNQIAFCTRDEPMHLLCVRGGNIK